MLLDTQKTWTSVVERLGKAPSPMLVSELRRFAAAHARLARNICGNLPMLIAGLPPKAQSV
ncbi:MAG: hypothetical protein N838_13830 [Thiohalocapsa sp. PB-PSB1]|nr:MAG: hypothetical protein N838_13830 [Thiohalocapsa sp. PB-PSB1]